MGETTLAIREVPAAKVLIFPESDELLPRHGSSIEENIVLEGHHLAPGQGSFPEALSLDEG